MVENPDLRVALFPAGREFRMLPFNRASFFSTWQVQAHLPGQAAPDQQILITQPSFRPGRSKPPSFQPGRRPPGWPSHSL